MVVMVCHQNFLLSGKKKYLGKLHHSFKSEAKCVTFPNINLTDQVEACRTLE